jgi:Uncharacterised nucleotidyltransferase
VTGNGGVLALLLSLLRGRAPRSGWPAAGDPRWEPALGLSERHGLSPLLHHATLAAGHQGSGYAALPAEARNSLRRARAAELAREERREAALHRALGALGGGPGERPIPALLYKGAASARTLYPAPELRPRGDLDLLIAPADTSEAWARLGRAGFQRHPALAGTPEDLPGWHERTLVDPVDPSQILDLHQALLQPERQRLLADRLLARSTPAPGLPPHARLPSPEDAALACALSLAAHELRSPMVAACDLALLLPRCDGPLLVSRAREGRVARALGLGLSWLVQLCEPRQAHARLCGVPVERELLQTLSRELGLSLALRSALARIAARYDLQRRRLGRPEQLLRKALLIDRPLDAARLAAAILRRGLHRFAD